MLDETKLFDFIKIMFTKPALYKGIKQHNKKRHFFMINRFFAIKYPENANAFNVNGIDGSYAVDSWAMLARKFTSVPFWIYTKTSKSKTAVVSKNQYVPSDKSVEIYMSKYEIGRREFNEMQKFAMNELNAELQSIEKSVQVY